MLVKSWKVEKVERDQKQLMESVMKVERFEDLIIWQEARELVKSIYKLTSKPQFKKDYGLRDQIQRASVSVMSNIPEGFERNNNNEFIHFLLISKGSAGELRSLLYASFDLDYINQNEFDENYQKAERVSKKISKFIHYLDANRKARYRKPSPSNL